MGFLFAQLSFAQTTTDSQISKATDTVDVCNKPARPINGIQVFSSNFVNHLNLKLKKGSRKHKMFSFKVDFIVLASGEISEVSIVGLDESVVSMHKLLPRVKKALAKSGAWSQAVYECEPVRAKFRLPIVINLK